MKKTGGKLLSLFQKGSKFHIYIATLLLTFGVYFSFPEKGLVATFPLMFLFSLAASFVYPVFWFGSVCAVGISFFYGTMASFEEPLLFAGASLLCQWAAYTFAFFIRKTASGNRFKKVIFLAVSLAVGILVPMLCLGTPVAYMNQKAEAEAYLQEKYPDQSFSHLMLYYHVGEKKYKGTVSYLLEENTLTSQMAFGDRVEDGFFVDYSAYVLIKQKSELLRVFSEKGLSVITEERELIFSDSDSVPGSYGKVSPELAKKAHFSITFRNEMPERRDFAEACATALSALQEANVPFGMIDFYALEAGEKVYTCQVQSDTDPESILSLVVKHS